MKLALEVFGLIMIVFSFLPLIKTTHWWIRVLDFPRPQVAFFLIVITGAYYYLYGAPTLLEKGFLLLMVLAMINEVLHFYKFTLLWPIEALPSKLKAPKNSFSIMISNVRMSNTHYDRFLQLVRENDPDILLINEPGHKWAQEISTLDTVYPYSIKCPLDNTYGMMFYSKFKLHQEEIRYLVEEDIPSFLHRCRTTYR